MKKLFSLVVIIFNSFILLAQQEPQFSHYMFNNMAMNPGATGLGGGICATTIYREQYRGIDGAPKTLTASIDAPISPFGYDSGIGLTIYNDEIGFSQRGNIKASYSYHLPFADGTLGIGLDGGIFIYSMDPEWTARNPGDLLIKNEAIDSYKFDLGFGAFYTNDEYYLGIATDNITSPVIQYQDPEVLDFMKMARHYYITGGMTVQLPIPLLEVTPGFLLKTDGATFQIDANARFVYNDKFWGGVSYRHRESVITMVGLELYNGLRLGIAYDFVFSRLATASSGYSGSYEVYLGYCFKIDRDKSPARYKSVRFL